MDVVLDKDNRSNVLQLFEGEGGAVKGNLYERYELRFENVFFLIASNRLPNWHEFRGENQLQRGENNDDY